MAGVEKRLTTLLGHLKASSVPSSVPSNGGAQGNEYRYTLADSCAGVLTSEERKSFEEDGFIVVKGLVAQQELDKYRERFRQICTREVTVSPFVTADHD